MSEMSAAEAATVARFDAADPAPESWRGDDGLREVDLLSSPGHDRDIARAIHNQSRQRGGVDDVQVRHLLAIGYRAGVAVQEPEVAALRAKAAAADRVRELAAKLGRPAFEDEDEGWTDALHYLAGEIRRALDEPC